MTAGHGGGPGARDGRRGGRGAGRPAAGPARRDPAGLPGAPGGADRRPDRDPGLPASWPRRDPHSAVDWSRVELWWGDERFVPADDDDRNAKQALDLLAAPLRLDPDRVHPMPASDGGADLDAGRRGYAAELGQHGLRHLPARAGPGRPRRVDLPRASVVLRRGRRDRRAVLAQAAAGADQPDPAGDQPVARGVVRGQRVGQGRRRQDGAARRRPGAGARPPACPGSSGRLADGPRRRRPAAPGPGGSAA